MVQSHSLYSLSYVSSTVLLTKSHPLLIVDLASTDHVVRKREAFMEYYWIPMETKWIYVGENAKVNVKGIGTCKLNLRDGQMLFVYNILYAPKIWWNLIPIVVLLGLGFNLNFQGNGLDLYGGDLFYGVEYFLDGFIGCWIIWCFC